MTSRGYRPHRVGAGEPHATQIAPRVRRRTFNHAILVMALQLGMGLRGARADSRASAAAAPLTADSMRLISELV